MSGIEDEKKRGAWEGLFLIFIFNVFDTVGRYMGGAVALPDKLVLLLTYLRAIFIATFLLIAFNVSPSWLFGDNADWFKIINMIVFSLSNGFLST